MSAGWIFGILIIYSGLYLVIITLKDIPRVTVANKSSEDLAYVPLKTPGTD